MKIGILHIVTDHLRTLYDAETGKLSITDFLIFYVSPTVLGVVYFYIGPGLSPNIYNASTSVFGIFAGLLLNVQVGLYNIYARVREKPQGELESFRNDAKAKSRTTLLRELNSNISYLILVSAVAIILSLAFYQMEKRSVCTSSILVAIYVHFILTFLMAIRRSYALFSEEYK